MADQLRIGIVGAGYIADIVAHAIQASDGATLVGVASRHRERAATFARTHGDIRVFDSWRDLVVWDGIDAVYIATPTAVRTEIGFVAAQHHKHLLADKPFASLRALQEMTAACRANQVAFMDATHFVHHPRTAQLKRERADRIGSVQSIHSAFHFPPLDRGNIRYDPAQEPMGAIGDMAWYTMRAIVEFAAPHAQLVSMSSLGQRDDTTGAVIRGAGALRLSDGSTATWDVGYTVGACVMDLNILGDRGMIQIDDFVLDWASGFSVANPDYAVGFTQRNGVAFPSAFVRVATPSAKRQVVLMIEQFVALTNDPTGVAVSASITASERTQALLDAVWANLAL